MIEHVRFDALCRTILTPRYNSFANFHFSLKPIDLTWILLQWMCCCLSNFPNVLAWYFVQNGATAFSVVVITLHAAQFKVIASCNITNEIISMRSVLIQSIYYYDNGSINWWGIKCANSMNIDICGMPYKFHITQSEASMQLRRNVSPFGL